MYSNKANIAYLQIYFKLCHVYPGVALKTWHDVRFNCNDTCPLQSSPTSPTDLCQTSYMQIGLQDLKYNACHCDVQDYPSCLWKEWPPNRNFLMPAQNLV